MARPASHPLRPVAEAVAEGGCRAAVEIGEEDDDAPPVVYIFDLDECLLMMESLRCGAYAAATAAEGGSSKGSTTGGAAAPSPPPRMA